jgi:ADP-ribose pyrophosphatase YjhB (NUDIX family)
MSTDSEQAIMAVVENEDAILDAVVSRETTRFMRDDRFCHEPMSGDLNEADVERRLARLREEYGAFPVDRREETWSDEAFAESVGYAQEGYTGGGYVWAVREPEQAADLTGSMPDTATQAHDRVLLILGRGYDWWAPAGGGREDGETYEEAAVREVREETGVDVEITDVARAERFTSAPDDDRDLRVHTLFVVFEGRYEDGHVAIQPGELNGAAWFRELPANLQPIAEPLADDWPGGRASEGGDGDEAGADP